MTHATTRATLRNAALALTTLWALPSGTAHAGEWRFGLGPSYVSGIRDVADLYEANFLAVNRNAFVESKLVIPVGIGFAADYHWDSGLRADIGLGPVFLIAGDAGDHSEVPLSATVGYSFFARSNTSPYVRAGVAHHFVSGDYYRSTSPGVLAAAGIEFARQHGMQFVLEVALDNSEVEFDQYTRTGSGALRLGAKTLNTYDTVVSLMVKF